jgi:hypothetical protein
MEKNYGRELKRKVDSKSNLTRREFLKTTGKIALVGMASTGPFYLKGPFAYGAEATIEDLTKGKVHIGDTITLDKVEHIKDFLPESTYQRMRKGLEIKLGPTTPKDKFRSGRFWEATERNKGLAVLDKNNRLRTKDGKPWIGGLPFPEPKSGIEVMYNLLERIWPGDDWYFESQIALIDSKGRLYSHRVNRFGGVFLRGRTELEPLGVYPGYEGEFMRMFFCYTLPFDLNGLAALTIRSDDPNKLDEMYAYIPSLRRTRRLSTAQRDDSPSGDDVPLCDYNTFDDPIGVWNFKILARKQMIIPGYTNDREPTKEGRWNMPRYAGKFLKFIYELRNVFVIEATPIGPRAYSKKIIYITDGFLGAPTAEAYDRAGKLWRSSEEGRGPALTKEPGKKNYVVMAKGNDFYDHQADHLTTFVTGGADTVNWGLKPSDLFEVKKLAELGVK